ncbi:MAG: phosphomannomutase/phosphoglucomutase [Candidatus Coproplasma sp.]
MESKSYKHLKSGSDIRGVAVATEFDEITLTREALGDITRAFLKWLSFKSGKKALKIAVGYDCRISNEVIFSIVKATILSCGCDVIECGLSSTPSMYMLLKDKEWNCDASVMITASHLPYQMNGLKFFTPEGGLSGNDINNILAYAENGYSLPQGEGKSTKKPYMNTYCNRLVETVRAACGTDMPLFGRIIVVDAGNGVGGFFANKVLKPLGAITSGSINLCPDGRFPAHIPNPELPEAMDALKKAVLFSKAQLGISFDTDVDRAAIVDGDGTPINRDKLIALISATILQEREATIVTDSVTSDGLTKFIANHGGKHIRFKRGYKNVIDEAVRRNNEGEYCPLAIETSGHAAFKENYFLDDGAYLICKLLITFYNQSLKGQKLGDLISKLELPVEENEVRLKFTEDCKNFSEEGLRILDELKFFAQSDPRVELVPNTYEGVRVNFAKGDGDGWMLVRQSVHDPVMPVNFASLSEGGNRAMANYLYTFASKYPCLDVSALKAFLDKQ